MTSPYRDEIDALRERKGSLEREIALLKQQTTQLDALRHRQQELERELASVDHRLGAKTTKRSLPLLDQVRVASPCNASWDEMLGDDRVRFCVTCEKNVFNLSAMPREEAERLLHERSGTDLCVRFYQRSDGTIMTEDCPVGVRKKRRKKIALAVAGAGAMTLAATTAFMRTTCRPVQGGMEPMMGEMAQPLSPNGAETGGLEPGPDTTPYVLGTAVVQPPSPPPPPHSMKMGHRAR